MFNKEKARQFLEEYDQLCRKYGYSLWYDGGYEPYEIINKEKTEYVTISELLDNTPPSKVIKGWLD